jgi:hypothetical protein
MTQEELNKVLVARINGLQKQIYALLIAIGILSAGSVAALIIRLILL